MAFEKFSESGKTFKPKVSFRKGGGIGLNAGAVRKFGLKQYSFAILYYDKERRLIGIKPTKSEDEEGARRMTHGGTGATIGAQGFMDFFEIDPPRDKRRDATWDDRERMIVGFACRLEPGDQPKGMKDGEANKEKGMHA